MVSRDLNFRDISRTREIDTHARSLARRSSCHRIAQRSAGCRGTTTMGFLNFLRTIERFQIYPVDNCVDKVSISDCLPERALRGSVIFPGEHRVPLIYVGTGRVCSSREGMGVYVTRASSRIKLGSANGHALFADDSILIFVWRKFW